MIHFIVYVHGHVGAPSDFTRLGNSVAERFATSSMDVLSLYSEVNAGLKTTRGIEACGHALYYEILEFSTRHAETLKSAGGVYLSFICHSLGGLIARYAAGLMTTIGFPFFSRWHRVTFMTLCSPHLGSRRPKEVSSLSRSAWSFLVNSVYLKWLAGVTGKDLLLSTPVIGVLSNPKMNFFKAVQAFQNPTLVSIVRGDWQVPFCSASLTPVMPYTSVLRNTIPTFLICKHDRFEGPLRDLFVAYMLRKVHSGHFSGSSSDRTGSEDEMSVSSEHPVEKKTKDVHDDDEGSHDDGNEGREVGSVESNGNENEHDDDVDDVDEKEEKEEEKEGEEDVVPSPGYIYSIDSEEEVEYSVQMMKDMNKIHWRRLDVDFGPWDRPVPFSWHDAIIGKGMYLRKTTKHAVNVCLNTLSEIILLDHALYLERELAE
jgi:hypothetical protein